MTRCDVCGRFGWGFRYVVITLRCGRGWDVRMCPECEAKHQH